MKPLSRLLIGSLIAGLICFGQSTQSTLTTDELEHLRFVLMNIASIDHYAGTVKSYEASLVLRFGLNSQEAAAVHAAGEELNGLLKQLRQSAAAITPGKSGLSQADHATLTALASQREERILLLVNRVLNQVRPETAARLRAPGRVVGAKGKK